MFRFPDTLDSNNVLDKRDAQIVLLAPRAAATPVDDGFVLTASGRRWSFPLIAKPLIDAVLSSNDVTVGEAIEANADVAEEQSAEMLFVLLRAGIVAIK